jgi:hypothetical protein
VVKGVRHRLNVTVIPIDYKERIAMKLGKYVAIVAVLVSLSLIAFAKDKNETRVTFSEKVQIGSTEVKPGDYKLQWDGNGPDVQVRIVKGKDVVATVPAKLLANKSTQGFNAITIRDFDTVNQLDQVDFAGGRQSLVFGEATETQNPSGGQQ